MEERIPLQAALALPATLAPAVLLSPVAVAGPPLLEKDSIPTTRGDLEITFVGHGSLYFRFAGKVLHVDPYGKLADYAALPKADVVLLTHAHGDHLDPAALAPAWSPCPGRSGIS